MYQVCMPKEKKKSVELDVSNNHVTLCSQKFEYKKNE